jgi:hypothetical protein
MDRYFAVITAPDPTMFAGLRDRGLGMFPCAGAVEGRPSAIEGLLTLTSSPGSARRGYEVAVSDPAEAWAGRGRPPTSRHGGS